MKTKHPERLFKAAGCALLFLLSHFEVGAQTLAITQPGPSATTRADVAILPSGVPFMAIQDATTIKALVCADATCTSVSSTVSVSPITASRLRTAIGADGFPVVSISIQNNGLRFVKCNNTSCSSNTIAILEPGNLGQTDHALVIPPDGRPLIAYNDGNAGDLKFVRCGDSSCLSGNVFASVDTVGVVGRAPSMTLVAGLPQIAYQADGSGLRLAMCGTLECAAPVFKSLAPDNVVHTSASTGRDGAAMVAFQSDTTTTDSLKVARCGNTACATVSNSVVDQLPNAATGVGVQLRQGADGLPVMSYLDVNQGTVRLARCLRGDCSQFTLTTVHAPTPSVLVNGAANGFAISASGTPLLAYSLAGKLTVHSCNTRSCQ